MVRGKGEGKGGEEGGLTEVRAFVIKKRSPCFSASPHPSMPIQGMAMRRGRPISGISAAYSLRSRGGGSVIRSSSEYELKSESGPSAACRLEGAMVGGPLHESEVARMGVPSHYIENAPEPQACDTQRCKHKPNSQQAQCIIIQLPINFRRP